MLDHDCHPWITWLITLVFTFSLILSVFYYYRCVLGDPGYLPKDIVDLNN
jgi:hypothetical protein